MDEFLIQWEKAEDNSWRMNLRSEHNLKATRIDTFFDKEHFVIIPEYF